MKGAADTHGQSFEVKLAAFLYTWAINKGINFQLFSNVAGAGKFDDIVFKWKSPEGHWLTCFFQLKHKTSTKDLISWNTLNTSKGDYYLNGFYDSFITIKKNMDEKTRGVFRGKIEHCLFVLFSNARHEIEDSEMERLSQSDTDNWSSFFSNFLKGNFETADTFKLNDYQYFPKCLIRDEFLGQFIICSGMPKEEDLDEYIATEIFKAGHVIDFDGITKQTIETFQGWSLSKDEEGVILCKKSSIIKEPEPQGSLLHKCSKLYLDIKFEPICLKEFQTFLEPHSFFHFFHSYEDPEVIFHKIPHVFTKGIQELKVLNLSDPEGKHKEILEAWKKNEFQTIILVADADHCGDSKRKMHRDLLKVINSVLKGCFNEMDDEKFNKKPFKSVVFLSSEVCALLKESEQTGAQLQELENNGRSFLQELKEHPSFLHIIVPNNNPKRVINSLRQAFNEFRKSFDFLNLSNEYREDRNKAWRESNASNILVLVAGDASKSDDNKFLHEISKTNSNKRVVYFSSVNCMHSMTSRQRKPSFLQVSYSHVSPVIIFNQLLQTLRCNERLYTLLHLSDTENSNCLSTWKNSRSRLLILVTDENKDKVAELALKEVINELEESFDKRVILISPQDNIKCSDHLEKTDLYKHHNQTFNITDIEEKKLNKLLSNEVEFQNQRVAKKMFKFDEFAQVIKPALVDFIIKPESYQDNKFGKKPELPEYAKVQRYHIDRTLKRRENKGSWKLKDLLEGKDRVVAVVSEPGMGKTILLQQLSSETKRTNPSRWVVYIQLRDNHKFLNHSFRPETHFFEMVKHSGDASPDHLEQTFLQHILNNTGNMYVALDGLDEVPHTCIDAVKKLVKYLFSETKVKKVWVTSRPSRENQLLELNATIYSLTTFTEEDQVRFLIEYWKKRPEGKLETEENTKDLVRNINSSLSADEKEFTSVPLQCMMIGEIFSKNSYQTSNISFKKFDLSKMYEMFTDEQFRIAYKEKKGVNPDDNPYEYDQFRTSEIKQHILASIILLLPDDIAIASKKVKAKFKSFAEAVQRGDIKVGIVYKIVEGKPVFLHRTYAEYFIAIWLFYEMTFKETGKRKFIEEKLYTADFRVVLNFFNRLLCRGGDADAGEKYTLHRAVLNRDQDQLTKLLAERGDVRSKDKGGRTPLHLAAAVAYDPERSKVNVEIVNTLLDADAMEDQEDEVLEWKPRLYAYHVKAYDILECFLKKKGHGEVDFEKRKSILDNEQELEIVIKLGCEEVMKLLLKPNPQNNEEKLKNDFCFIKYNKSSLLHRASYHGQDKVAKVLLKEGIKLEALNGHKETALHTSVKQNHLKVTQLLLNTAQSSQCVDMKDRNGCTALHRAVQRSDEEIVIQLLEAKADPTERDEHQQTPLHKAARLGKVKVVELLLDTIRDNVIEYINTKDSRGFTAIHEGADGGHVAVVELLANRGGDIRYVTNDGSTSLMRAALNGDLATVEVIVKHYRNNYGSPANFIHEKRNRWEDSAIEIANRWKNSEVVEYLTRELSY